MLLAGRPGNLDFFLNSTLQPQQPVSCSQGLLVAQLVLTGQERLFLVPWDKKLVARLSRLFQFNLFYVLEGVEQTTHGPPERTLTWQLQGSWESLRMRVAHVSSARFDFQSSLCIRSKVWKGQWIPFLI